MTHLSHLLIRIFSLLNKIYYVSIEISDMLYFTTNMAIKISNIVYKILI